ncbi:MAG TPA: hypothetical protein VH022_14365 [Candidatus Acidoferrum sp.]|jgi:hypothetical protein|nr:hypothetical protein [Candidatus Acidoferrum sp.]
MTPAIYLAIGNLIFLAGGAYALLQANKKAIDGAVRQINGVGAKNRELADLSDRDFLRITVVLLLNARDDQARAEIARYMLGRTK